MSRSYQSRDVTQPIARVDRSHESWMRPNHDWSLTPAGCMAMQGTCGNAFVQEMIQRKAAGTPGRDAAGAFRDATRGGGMGLPHLDRMEEAFDEDFSGVRAYVGTGEAMDELGAHAAACGDEVVFESANPSQELVAHELTHVVQQSEGAVQASSRTSRPGDSAEREADAVASRVARGEPAGEVGASGEGIHLDPRSDLEKEMAERRAKRDAPYDEYGIHKPPISWMESLVDRAGPPEIMNSPDTPWYEKVPRGFLAAGAGFAGHVMDSLSPVNTDGSGRLPVPILGEILHAEHEKHYREQRQKAVEQEAAEREEDRLRQEAAWEEQCSQATPADDEMWRACQGEEGQCVMPDADPKKVKQVCE